MLYMKNLLLLVMWVFLGTTYSDSECIHSQILIYNLLQVNENGEVVKKEESGPWNKKDAERTNSNEGADSPTVETKPIPAVSEPPNVVGGTYVPPGRRGGDPASNLAPMRMSETSQRPRK